MFSWIKSKGARVDQKRRAFRPGADRLEPREVLSTLPHTAAATPRALPAFQPNANLSFATRGMQAANLYGGQNTAATVNRTVSNVAGIVSSVITAPTNFSVPAPRVNATTAARTVARTLTSNLPRLGGFNSNVNTGAALSSALNAAGTAFGNSSATANSAAAVTNGLAFTNGLGFTNPSSQSTSGAGSNTALNGLAFTNGLGFSNPSSGSNAASNGLAFTNGTGFSVPARQVGTSNNAASTGLAFTNGLGGTLPAGFNSLFSSVNNGLTFTNGLGFTNANQNPFLRGTTTTASGPSFTSPGLNGGSFSLGGLGGSSSMSTFL